MLSKGRKLVVYFNEKLSGLKLNYNTYDVEFYTLVQALKHWSSYLAFNEFILYLDHEVLKHLHSQDKLSSRHVSWAAYIQQFFFIIKYKSRALNKVADVLRRKALLFPTLRTKVLGLILKKNILCLMIHYLVLLLVMWQLVIEMTFFYTTDFSSKESIVNS